MDGDARRDLRPLLDDAGRASPTALRCSQTEAQTDSSYTRTQVLTFDGWLCHLHRWSSRRSSTAGSSSATSTPRSSSCRGRRWTTRCAPQTDGQARARPMTSVYVSRPLPAPGRTLLRAAGFDVEAARRRRAAVARGACSHASPTRRPILSMLTERIDAELMDAAPGLRVVANLAVGLRQHRRAPAATERGIVVTNTPDVLTEATADLAWALLMAAARRLGEGERLVRAGSGRAGVRPSCSARRCGDRTIGIVGMGKIGTAVARRRPWIRDDGALPQPYVASRRGSRAWRAGWSICRRCGATPTSCPCTRR